MGKQNRFTLEPKAWYAAEFIGDEFDGLRHYSPIQVHSVRRLHVGNRTFSLEYFHANYPAGAQAKLYTLQTIERAEHYLLARSTEHSPMRILLIFEINWDWLRLHFPVQNFNPADDLSSWLSRNT